MALHHIRRGSGEPLLLIQGMSGHSLHWGDEFFDDLARDFDVIAFDNRGTGQSPRVDAPFSIADMADDAAGVLDELGLESAHVLGISMGGMIAQELALAQPGRVRTLTLGCTYCGGDGSALAAPAVMQKLGDAMMSGDRARALRAGFEINLSAPAAADEGTWKAFLAIAERRSVAVSVVMAQLQACTSHDTNARLARLQMPTLVIHGTEDQLLPVANGHLIASLIPGSRLEILDGVGHMFWWEQPERAAELIAAHAAVAA
jgi:3-oxoadipate enol-lactonase